MPIFPYILPYIKLPKLQKWYKDFWDRHVADYVYIAPDKFL